MPKSKRKSSGRMASKGFPNPIDVHVGGRIRVAPHAARRQPGCSCRSDRTHFQQVQKYESGANRVSSSWLVDIGNVLDVSIPYVFDEMGAGVQKQTPAMVVNAKKLPEADHEKDAMVRRETLELVRAYYRIPDPTVRKRLADMVKTVAKSGE